MADFRRSCQECFGKDGMTVLLEERDGKWVCPRDPSHTNTNNIIVC